MSEVRGWEHARRVLAVRLDAIGDVIMTTPALRALAGRPPRRVTLLTSSAGAAVAPLLSDLDGLMVYDPPWMKATPQRTDTALDLAMITRLRGARFDAAVIFTVYSQNPLPAALTCYLAEIPLRLAHCRENPYQLLTDWVRDPEPDECIRHEVRRQLDLVATVGAFTEDDRLGLRIPDQARDRVRALLAEVGVADDGFVVVHPGGTAASRRYPADAFAEVARDLTLAVGRDIIFTGTAAESPLITEIQGMMGVRSYSLAGRLDLGALAALLARAPLLVSNNTAPVHIAAAVGTPVVDLYALTNPQHTPWRVPHRALFHDVPCKYCYKSVCPLGHQACLRGVAPEEVVGAALALLKERGSHARLGLSQGDVQRVD